MAPGNLQAFEASLPSAVATVAAHREPQLEAVVPANPFLANLSKREIPSLNGLRGFAAVAVVLFHYLKEWKWDQFFPAPYAVTLFFELSGLLITWLLLTEMENNGRVDKKQFYFRRALRLFPVFYVVWGLCRLSGPFPGSWATFFYMGDYYHALTKDYNVLTVAWSLGVEEKFYFLWPFLLTRIHHDRLVKICFAVLFIQPVYRAFLVFLGYGHYTWFAFDTHLDAIVLGCLLALVAKRGWVAPRWLARPWVPVGALILVFALQSQGDIIIYLLGIILVAAICRPTYILNNPVAKYLGAISYSLYLSHGYARDVVWSWLFANTNLHNAALLFVFQFAVSIAVASLLHFLVERPFLKLKDRFHKKSKAPATEALAMGSSKG